MANMSNTSNMQRLFDTAGSKQTQQGTGYTNLNRLFEANQNNKLGQKVSGDVSSQIGNVKTQLGQQQTDFSKNAEANRLDSDTNKQQRDAVIGRFADASSGGGDLNDKDVEAFSKYRAGQYAGPSGLADTSALSGTATDLTQQTSNFTPSGTQELLRRSVGGDRYTQGQNRLDSLLLDRSALTPLQRQASALGQNINKANLAAQGQAQLLRNQAEQFGVETKSSLQNAMTGLDSVAAQQLATAQKAEADRVAKLQAIQKFATDSSSRGATDAAAQFDNLSNVLKGQGISDDEITKLLGGGNFAQKQSQYNTALSAAENQRKQSALNHALYSVTSNSSQSLSGIDDSYYSEVPSGSYDTWGQPIMTRALNKEKLVSDVQSGKLNPANLGIIQARDGYDNSSYDTGETLSNLASNYAKQAEFTNPYNATKAAQDAQFYGTTGLAGQALQSGKQEDFYKNLAASLNANSTNALGLTAQGVASEPLRNNYAALSKLLGTADTNQYAGQPTYQAGNLGLNSEQIRRALGL